MVNQLVLRWWECYQYLDLKCRWIEISGFSVTSTVRPASWAQVHLREPCFDFGLDDPFDLWYLGMRVARTSGGRKAGRLTGWLLSTVGGLAQEGRWCSNALSLQSRVTSKESCLQQGVICFWCSLCGTARNILPQQWKENEQWQKLKCRTEKGS